MIKTLFFAKIRDELGVSEVALNVAEGFPGIEQMIAAVALQLGNEAMQVLSQPNIVVAINQTVAEPGQAIRDGDEVAFYPPVTGG